MTSLAANDLTVHLLHRIALFPSNRPGYHEVLLLRTVQYTAMMHTQLYTIQYVRTEQCGQQCGQRAGRTPAALYFKNWVMSLVVPGLASARTRIMLRFPVSRYLTGPFEITVDLVQSSTWTESRAK
jgi:hypothetical protein